mmetsp:Transcript_6405/g.15955  ORF Transcript_6405/g.15955 Transcript_6405/m.15955 type:complete len:294 (+) Transcript_6405:100-981(+)
MTATLLISALLLLGLFGTSTSFTPTNNFPATRRPSATKVYLFNAGATSGGTAKIPSSTNDRDNAAIAAVKAAVKKPRNASCPLIECEFPALAALNKLGDGSLRSSLEAEDANVAFASKLVGGISNPFFGPSVSLVVSSSASNSLVNKVKKKVKGATLYSLKDGMPDIQGKDSICVFLTPSSQRDYQAARSLAESGCASVIVNGSFKDQKSIPGSATMAYYVKPLTYNSQVSGYLIRSYPSSWTVLDAQSKSVLGSFSDDTILVDRTNTPDLRESGRLVQKSVDERAIRARSKM